MRAHMPHERPLPCGSKTQTLFRTIKCNLWSNALIIFYRVSEALMYNLLCDYFLLKGVYLEVDFVFKNI